VPLTISLQQKNKDINPKTTTKREHLNILKSNLALMAARATNKMGTGRLNT
jgi:hypothetical protein